MLRKFQVGEEEVAGIYLSQTPEGPQIIDVCMITISTAKARRLAGWLQKAADLVDEYNKKRRSKSHPNRIKIQREGEE